MSSTRMVLMYGLYVFHEERIPAHKLILVTMSPWFDTMFFGSLPENNEVNMTQTNVSAETD